MVNIINREVLNLVHYNAKIMDINEDDAQLHTCSLAGIFPPNVTALIVMAIRKSGSSHLKVWPVGATTGDGYIRLQTQQLNSGCVLTIADQQIVYQQGGANDDFDLYCFGYFVKGPLNE